MVIEYENVGLELANDSDMFLNFQLWLYENDNSFEVHIGPNNCDTSAWFDAIGPYVGVDSMNTFNGQYLKGTASNPTLTGNIDDQLNGSPPANIVYRFVPSTVGLSSLNTVNFSYAPNPITDQLFLKGNESIQSLYLTDMLGRWHRVNFTTSPAETIVDLNQLQKGIYLVHIQTQLGQQVVKIFKQ